MGVKGVDERHTSLDQGKLVTEPGRSNHAYFRFVKCIVDLEKRVFLLVSVSVLTSIGVERIGTRSDGAGDSRIQCSKGRPHGE